MTEDNKNFLIGWAGAVLIVAIVTSGFTLSAFSPPQPARSPAQTCANSNSDTRNSSFCMEALKQEGLKQYKPVSE